MSLLLDTHVFLWRMPLLHRDPFVRLLISVAAEEGLTLLTDERMTGQYGIPLAW